MIFIVFIVTVTFLAILSYIDIMTFNKRDGAIPSIITDLFLITAFIMSGGNMYFACMAILFGLMLTDLEFWSGWADFKVFVALGMLMRTNTMFFAYAINLSVFVFAYKTGLLWYFKSSKRQIPLIPAFLVTFLLLNIAF